MCSRHYRHPDSKDQELLRKIKKLKAVAEKEKRRRSERPGRKNKRKRRKINEGRNHPVWSTVQSIRVRENERKTRASHQVADRHTHCAGVLAKGSGLPVIELK